MGTDASQALVVVLAEEDLMTTTSPSLKRVYDGWDSHQQALMHAVTPLLPAHLAWRPAPDQSSVNELIAHIAGARLWWFYKMNAPGSAALARQIAPWAGETFNAGIATRSTDGWRRTCTGRRG
jgi:hypothetical protein